MKTGKYYVMALFLLATICFKAQTSIEWSPVLNSPDGTNTNVGVTATCKLSTCGSEDVILLKLVNDNKYALKATWVGMIETEDGRELYGKQTKMTLSLAPNSEVSGNCKNNITELVIKLKDYGIKANEFKFFSAANFALIQKN